MSDSGIPETGSLTGAIFRTSRCPAHETEHFIIFISVSCADVSGSISVPRLKLSIFNVTQNVKIITLISEAIKKKTLKLYFVLKGCK